VSKNLIRNLLQSFRSQSGFGLVVDWGFHLKNKWVSAYTPFLVDAIVRELNPIIIDSRLSYLIHKKKLKYILSFEPGISAPAITYDRTIPCKKGIIYSDPHYKPLQRMRYFESNGFDVVFSLYKRPFFRHFKGFPADKFVHWPWAVPDHLISTHPIRARTDVVAIFGGRASKAYDVRNWCRRQPGVTNYDFSGVENKRLDNAQFYRWLSEFDAVVAAGSSNPDYDLVTPKYFEIAAAGALLIGQQCEDLQDLGFTDRNALIFTKQDFVEKVEAFRNNPTAFVERRKRGRELVRTRHKLSDRVRCLREVLFEA
jgi:hypothetical protein